jgi:serine/threonine protein kinase
VWVFPDLYELTEEVLGKGAKSCVTTCIRKSTQKQYAVKMIPKTSDYEREKVLREIEILFLCRENRLAGSGKCDVGYASLVFAVRSFTLLKLLRIRNGEWEERGRRD